MQALVSIIIPVYNRGDLIGETLESIISQSYENWECILVDDGSTDKSWEIMLQYQQLDPRFKVFKRNKQHLPGGSGARNYGFELSEGKLINWFDSDDLMHKDHLSKKVQIFIQNPNIDIVFCSCIHFENSVENTSKIWHVNSSNILHDQIIDKISIQTSLPMFSKSFLQNKELFPEDIHMAEEWVLFCRLLMLNPNYSNIDKPLIYYRVHEIQKLKTVSLEMLHSEMEARLSVFSLLKENDKLDRDIYGFYSQVCLRLIRKAKGIGSISFTLIPLRFFLRNLLPKYSSLLRNSMIFLFEYVLFILFSRSGLRWSITYFSDAKNLKRIL